MMFETPPANLVAGQQITPEVLNRNILAARAQLEDAASKCWRIFEINIPPHGSTNICRLPYINGLEYIIDRITISGTYTGQPTITYRLEQDSVAKTFILPANGFDGANYVGVISPGFLLDGASTSHLNDFIMTIDTYQPNLRYTITCRTRRDTIATSNKMPDIELYLDNDTITADRITTDQLVVSTFATEIDNQTHATRPKQIHGVYFFDVAAADPEAYRSDHINRTGIQHVSRVCGHIQLATAGGVSPLAVMYGFGSYSGSTNITVNGQTSIDFDISVDLTNNNNHFYVKFDNVIETITLGQIYVVSSGGV